MGWLKRLFGMEKPQSAPQPGQSAPQVAAQPAQASIPAERVGLSGEYDQSGLAKRVALAFDNDPDIDDIDTLYVAQTGSTVVLKGAVPSQPILNRMIVTAQKVNGATNVDADQVTVS